MSVPKIKIRHVTIIFVAVLFLSSFLTDKLNARDFTLDDFYKCEEGMTYEEVEQILGGKGEVVASDRDNPNEETYHYRWISSHGGTASIRFVNGKLVYKTEHELKKESELDR